MSWWQWWIAGSVTVAIVVISAMRNAPLIDEDEDDEHLGI